MCYQGKISVITVTYNAEKVIERTIRSVLNQTYPNIEYIIIDGASKDNTMSVILEYKENVSKYLSEKDKGIYDAMNKGLGLATGEWVIFMNAGDEFIDKDVIANFFSNAYTKDTGCVFGDTKSLDKYGKLYVNYIHPFFMQSGNIREFGLCHQACFVRTDLAKKLKFDTSYKRCADFNMAVQIRKMGYKFYYKPIVVCIYDKSGYSAQNLYTGMKEKALVSGLPLTLPTRCLIIISCLKKKIRIRLKTFCYLLFRCHVRWPYRLINKVRTESNAKLVEGYM